MENITEKLEKILGKSENILKDELMSKHTSFKIGGMSDYFIHVEKIEQLVELLKFAEENELPFQVVGNGTNLLVRDGGIRGFVIKLGLTQYTMEQVENDVYMTCGCGRSLSSVAFVALQNKLTGLEAMAGIPGTLGGAVRMNAGAYGSEMKDVVVRSKCMDKKGNIQQLDWQEHAFSYRRSAFEDNGLILLETTLKLKKGNQEEIQKKMQEYKASRSQKQPLEFPNAGSIFKRNNDVSVAKLIDECGLKGYSIGDAEVSKKHAGFIINKGNATAKDVLNLIDVIQKRVKERFDVEIEQEVIVLGEEKE